MFIPRPRLFQGFGENAAWYKERFGIIGGHNGLDYVASHGTPIRACHDGVVTYAGQDSAEGWGVRIITHDTYDYKEKDVYFETLYWHLIPDIPVKAGHKVKSGDIIGYADNTGMSTGSHLHFGLKPKMKTTGGTYYNVEQNNGHYGAIDPRPYFNGYMAINARSVIQNLKQQVETLRKILELLRIVKKR